jgi:hypothetical protein
MELSRREWCRRFSEHLVSIKEVRQATSDDLADKQYAVVNHLLPEEAARCMPSTSRLHAISEVRNSRLRSEHSRTSPRGARGGDWAQ